MKIDLHGNILVEALDEILLCLEECELIGDNHVEIVHGYRHGQILKNYVQSEKFIREMARAGYALIRTNSPNRGTSCFELK